MTEVDAQNGTTTRECHTLDGMTFSAHMGLNTDQVSQLRGRYGPNTLTPPRRDPWWKLFLEKFSDPTIRILLAAAVISVAMTAVERWLLRNPHAGFVDSMGILMAVLLATLVGYFSERRSAREFELLSQVKDDIPVKVLRDGQLTKIPIGEIVVGDVVRLDMGDRIPADGVLVDQLGLLIDEAMLTGESVPAEKTAYPEGELTGECVPDSARVYRGTMVSDGHGEFIVTRVGDATEMGAIAANLGSDAQTENETPLTHKLSVLAKQISVTGVSGAMLIFTVMTIEAVLVHPVHMKDGSAGDPVSPSVMFPLVALVLGYAGMRYLLRPFFRSMGMDLTRWWLRLTTMIPMSVADMEFAVAPCVK
ncbi:MAG: cation-transporting P-type ATPase, partial [Planctomycetia bacterium]|nr:cation-transporting P-type ATPase [Planctomycetia bacterium]